jgi:hypothetical protein
MCKERRGDLKGASGSLNLFKQDYTFNHSSKSLLSSAFSAVNIPRDYSGILKTNLSFLDSIKTF